MNITVTSLIHYTDRWTNRPIPVCIQTDGKFIWSCISPRAKSPANSRRKASRLRLPSIFFSPSERGRGSTARKITLSALDGRSQANYSLSPVTLHFKVTAPLDRAPGVIERARGTQNGRRITIDFADGPRSQSVGRRLCATRVQ